MRKRKAKTAADMVVAAAKSKAKKSSKAKSSKSSASKERKLRCKEKGCRRVRTHGCYCKAHVKADAAPKGNNGTPRLAPGEVLEMTLDPLDAESWGRLDAELRSLQAERQVLALQQQADEAALKERTNQRIQRMSAIDSEIRDRRAQYEGVVKGLSTRYGIPKQDMTLDPDARVIRNVGP